MPSLDRATERSRLVGEGAGAGLPPGFWPMRLAVRCDGPAAAVLGRVRDVLADILRQDPEAWPDEDAWPALLPGWFVAACAPERTPEQAAADLAAWRENLDAGRHGKVESRAWSVADFVYWFTPEMRNWWWWDATLTAPDAFALTLVADEVDPPRDALLWLLRAAGAAAVTG
jgi:hypothetical protein